MPASELQAHLGIVLALVVAALGAGFDLKTGTIPNWVTYPGLILGPIVHVARAASVKASPDIALREGLFSLAGAAICGLVPWLLYRRGGMGGADVKLFAAIGALLQVSVGIEAQLYALVAASLMAPAKLAYDGKLWSTMKNAATIGLNVFLPRDKQKSVDESLFTWLRLGPAVLFGVAFAAYQHW